MPQVIQGVGKLCYRVQEEELLYVLRKFQELQLWAGSLWAAFSGDPSTYCTSLPRKLSKLPSVSDEKY
jgi:protein MON2